MRKDVSDAFEIIDSKICDMREHLLEEEKIARIVEDKLFEVRIICYLLLLIAVVLLFIVLGALMKAVGF